MTTGRPPGTSTGGDCWGELRGRVEALFDAPAGSVALMPSTSACLAAISSSLDWKKRNRIVTTELDFPTLLYQWKVRPDAEMVVLESPDGVHIDPQQFADAVDDRTLAIATSHVFFTTGAIQDLAAIADIARRAGAYSLIDGYQGAGQVAVDLPATGVDFYTAGPLKWLCGGPGLAYLYVREDLIAGLEPRITSWFATRDPFDFNSGDFRYHDDARRFELGTPALATVHHRRQPTGGGAGQSPLLQHGGRCGRVRGGAQRNSVRRARLGRTLWIERQLRNVVPVDSAPRNTRRIVRCGRAVYEDDQGRSQQIEPHRTVTHLDCTDVPCSCVEIEIRRVTLDTCRQGPQSAPVVEAEAWPVPNLGPAPVLFDLRLGGLNPPSDPFRSLDVGVNFLRASKLLHVRGTWVHCGVVNPITSAIDQIGGEEAVPRNFAGIHIDFSLV